MDIDFGTEWPLPGVLSVPRVTLARWSVEWLAIRAWPLLEIRFIDMLNFFERVSIERERTPRSAVEARDKLRAH